jgi:hypothetical protein
METKPNFLPGSGPADRDRGWPDPTCSQAGSQTGRYHRVRPGSMGEAIRMQSLTGRSLPEFRCEYGEGLVW